MNDHHDSDGLVTELEKASSQALDALGELERHHRQEDAIAGCRKELVVWFGAVLGVAGAALVAAVIRSCS